MKNLVFESALLMVTSGLLLNASAYAAGGCVLTQTSWSKDLHNGSLSGHRVKTAMQDCNSEDLTVKNSAVSTDSFEACRLLARDLLNKTDQTFTRYSYEGKQLRYAAYPSKQQRAIKEESKIWINEDGKIIDNDSDMDRDAFTFNYKEVPIDVDHSCAGPISYVLIDFTDPREGTVINAKLSRVLK